MRAVNCKEHKKNQLMDKLRYKSIGFSLITILCYVALKWIFQLAEKLS
jgi:hypothetical protein